MRKKWRVGMLIVLEIAIMCLILTNTVLAASEEGSGRVIVCLQGGALSVQSVDEELQWEPLMDVTMENTMDAESGVATQSLESQTLFLVTSSTMDNATLISLLEAREDVLFAEPDTYTTLDDGTGGIDTYRIEGWDWLRQVKQTGVEVRAVNVSIGGNYVSRAERMAAAAADQAGITTIFSSGNDSMDVDLDETDTAMVRSGSVLNVNAIEASGQASPFTNYGKNQTDLYAPGSTVLSTAAGTARTFNAFCAAQDSNRTVVYEGFEEEGSADLVDPDVNGGLDFCYYDENQKDDCGEAVTVGDDYYSGEHGLDIPADGQETVTIISTPVNYSENEAVQNVLAKTEQLYRGYCMWSESGHVQIKCDFKLTDGSFSDTTAESMGHYQWRNSGNSGNGGSNLQQMPEAVDFENFQMKITITFLDTTNTLHLDSIGVGTGLDSYTVYGGTSMAAPAVTGAFALLASNHTTECSAKISGRILGGTLDQEDFAETCTSGGQLNINKANEDPDPAIQKVASDGNTIVLEGWFIGASGSVTIGGQPAEMKSWKEDTDTEIGRIMVRQPEGLTGAQMAVVTDETGQSGSKQVSVPVAGNYIDLSIPQDEAYDTVGTAGLAALGEDIYLIGGDIITDEATLWKYDTVNDTWTNLGKADMADFVGFYCQMVGHEGKLYVMAYGTDPQTQNTVGELWQYTPESKEWAQITTDKELPVVATPVSYQGKLLLVGGESDNDDGWGLSNQILQVDVDAGKATCIFKLPEGMELARTAVSGDKLAIASCVTQSGNPFFGITDLNTVTSCTLPAVDAGQQMEMALGSTAEGFILTGLVSSTGGTWQDTWYYNLVDESFADAGKVLSTAKTFRNVGITVGNAFYVWGQSSQVEELSFFRKTNVPTAYVLTPSVNDTDMGTDSPTTKNDVRANHIVKTVSTGDSNTIVIYIVLVLVSVGIIGIVLARRQRKNSTKRGNHTRKNS